MIPKVHPNFMFNGRSLNHEGLMTVAYSYVKEGDVWEQQIGDFILNWLDNFDVMTVYTSGSTGAPRAYKLDKQHMINSAELTADLFDVHYDTIALCCLPLSYIAGKMMLVRAMHLGWHIDTIEPTLSPLNDAKKRYDFTAMTPMQLSNSLDNIHKSRTILLGGAAISDALIEKLQGKHTRAYHSYGMTETCSHVAVRSLYPKLEEHYTAVGDASFTATTSSCLVIKAPSVVDGDLETNDIVELLDEKRFKIVGRLDDVINSGGVKIHPEKVEEKLATFITERFFIAGLDDEELGQKVVLLVEGPSQDLTKYFKKLDKFEQPKEVYFVDKFAETHTKKIDKRSVLEGLEESF
ncbi:MAG: AMP-binding protein [Nonlabens sp.]|nr:AMP-binding protein [Nonlabens sp.]